MNLMKVSLMGLCLVAGMTAWAQNDAGLQDLADLLGGGRPTDSVEVAEEAPASAPAQTTPTQEVTQSRAKSERFSVGASSGGSVGAGLPANMAVGATRTKTATPRKPAGDPNIREVIGKGYGATRQEALTNACRDAIEFAVGLFVDSETLVDNCEMKKDEIITQSNGYVALDAAPLVVVRVFQIGRYVHGILRFLLGSLLLFRCKYNCYFCNSKDFRYKFNTKSSRTCNRPVRTRDRGTDAGKERLDGSRFSAAGRIRSP